MMQGEERTASYTELLAELMAKIEDLQATPEGRQELATNANRYANAIRIGRNGAASEMQTEMGRKIQPTN